MKNGNEFVKFNINHHVHVKLTKSGIDEYLKHYNEKYTLHNPKLSLSKEDFIKRIDVDGYYEFQMHEFMEVFGKDVRSEYFDFNILFSKKELIRNE